MAEHPPDVARSDSALSHGSTIRGYLIWHIDEKARQHLDNFEEKPPHNPMKHPDEQPGGLPDSPRFGRLLIVLALAVLFVGLLTVVSEAYYTP